MARRSLDETWLLLEARGEAPPRVDGLPFLPAHRPLPDDEQLGFEFFRTEVSGDWSNLTLPRTFFGRSLVSNSQFVDTDLTESNLCWNDFVSVDFRLAVLNGADLRASLFEDCSFRGASLRGADLRQSSYERCDFRDADLADAVVARGEPVLELLSAKQRAEVHLVEQPGPEPAGG